MKIQSAAQRSDQVAVEIIQNKIYLIRGRRVMFADDLARMYGVLTKNLNKAVARNSDRFPDDFCFQLTKEECEHSRFQIGTLKRGGNIKYLPYVFTQEGVAMLSSILRSKRAIAVNIQIMRVFTSVSDMMASHKDLALKIEQLERHVGGHDKQIALIFEAIKRLLAEKEDPPKPKIPFGFHMPRIGK